MGNRFIDYLRGPEGRPGEARLLRKLDFFILSFCCLMYFANYLDRSNLANAYVSGMKEDLDFHGKQFNLINTIFTVGYVLGQVPSNLALYRLKPRYFLPGMMVIWGGLTMATAGVHNPQGIMVIRFFLGLAESSTFVGTHYILGSWYTERELGKRSGIFTASGLAGTMFGGFIQTGINSSLHMKGGLPGWRWLFIIDGLITIPIAVYGFFLFPDTPRTTRAPYLTAADKELAVARLPSPSDDDAEHTKINFALAKRVFSTWHLYGFVILWVIAGETESFSTNSLLALYMKSHPTIKYTVAQNNNYPSGIPAVGIVSTLIWATLTDFLGGKRYLVGYWIGITGVVTSAMILAPGSSTATIFAAYYWAGSVYACQATFFAWANDVMRYKDDAWRSVVIAGMNMGSNVINAWWSIVFYPASDAPYFRVRLNNIPASLFPGYFRTNQMQSGMYAMIACSIAMAIWTGFVMYMSWREGKQMVDSQQTVEKQDSQCKDS